MATEEETYRLIIQFENEEKLKTVTAAASLADQKFKALYDQLGAGNAKTRAAAASLSDLNRKLEETAKSTRNWGRAGLEASRAIEDAQYGIAGVLNNIPSLIQMLGGGAGLAGAISVAAVASKVLYDHWGDLTKQFGFGTTKTEAQQMEELKDKTQKTADETMRLLKYEKERHVLAVQNAPNKKVAATEQGISEAINEVGPGKVDEAINQLHGDRIRNSVSDEKTQAARQAKGKLNTAQGVLDDLARQDPGQVSKHQFDQARKTRDKYQEEFNKAVEAFNQEYGEKREKFRAGLATDVDKQGNAPKLEKFIADAVAKGLLTGDEVEKLRNSTPKRRAEMEEEARDHKDRMDLDSRQAKHEEENRQRDIERSSAGLQEKFSPEILNNVARGKANDQAGLAAKVSQALQLSGKSKEEADSVSDQIASELIEKVEGRVRERAGQQGLTKEEAGARELEDDTAAARSRAPKPKGAITDASGFANSLQMALFNKQDPIQQAILEEARKAATMREKLVEELRKVKPRQLPAVAAGPG